MFPLHSNHRKVERFVQVPKTHYDQIMGKVYDPNDVALHPAPWPMQRSTFDIAMLNKWDTWEKSKPQWMSFPSKGPSMQPFDSCL